jgi:hypothetical protein
MFRCKARADPCIFSKGEFYALNLAFEGGNSQVMAFKGGGSIIGFQKGSPLSKCVYLHCPLF